jgi:hypothetical protein
MREMLAEIKTWRELYRAIGEMTGEQGDQRIQVILSTANDSDVLPLMPGIALATIADLQFDKTRDSIDNSHRPEGVVLFVDHNPFDEDGCWAENLLTAEKLYVEKKQA